MDVRFATPRDYQEFNAVYVMYQQRGLPKKAESYAKPFDEKQFVEEAASSIVLAVDEAGAIHGFANIADIGGGTIKIYDFFSVKADFEVEQQILKYVEDIARELGFKRLMLWNFDLEDDGRLYHLGFKCVMVGDGTYDDDGNEYKKATDEFEKLL